MGRMLWWRRRRFWKLKSCPWRGNCTGMWDWPRMLKAREVCSSIQDEWKFAVTTISTSWQGLLETCQQRESTYGTSFTPFQSGEKSGRRGRMLTVNIQDKGGEEFFKSKRAKASLRFQDKAKGVSTVGLTSCQPYGFPASLSTHHCPARQSAHGMAQSVTDSSILMIWPMVSLSSSFIFHILLHPSRDPLQHPPCWSRHAFKGRAENALLHSTPFFQQIKSRWNTPAGSLRSERDRCDVCVGMRAFWQWQRCGNSRLQT